MRTPQRIRRLTCGAPAVLIACAIAACGGSSDNGVAAKSPDAIVNSAMRAIGGAKTAHVSGSLASGGTHVTLDLQYISGKGAQGQVTENGMAYRLVVIGRTAYLNAAPAVWRRVGGAAAVQLLQGRWLKVPSTSPDYASFEQITSVNRLMSGALSNHGKLARGAKTTIRGAPAVTVLDTTEGGTLYVATTGKPFPLEFTNKGSSGPNAAPAGHLTIDRINQTVSLNAPTDSIDISQLPSG
jgi:hypothetical protein